LWEKVLAYQKLLNDKNRHRSKRNNNNRPIYGAVIKQKDISALAE